MVLVDMVNKFFNNYMSLTEQKLAMDLNAEAIGFAGMDVYYVSRTGTKKDDILNEYSFSKFEHATQVEMYLKNFNSFEGDGILMEKFGIEIRDQIILSVSKKTFERDIIQNMSWMFRPREGDLIWVPVLNAAYEIRYVNNTTMFYQFGEVQTYELVCDLFEYAQELFTTGIAEIDDFYSKQYNTYEEFLLTDEDGNVITDEEGEEIAYDYDVENNDTGADNLEFEDKGDDILDWTEKNPWGVIDL